MKLLDLVKQRYSCRSYLEKSVEQEKLDYVMECVRFAPSAVNKQPWKCKQLFGIGDTEEPAVLIPIGYAADELKEKKRKEIEDIYK